jgi:hypothetical protein
MVIFHSFLYVYQRVSGRISWFPTNWWPLVFLFCLILSVAKSASRGKRFHLQLPPGNAKLRRRLQHLQVITIPGRFMALALPHSKKTKKKKTLHSCPKNSQKLIGFNMFQPCPCSFVHTLVAQPSHFWPLRLKALTTARTSNIREAKSMAFI